MPPDRAFSHRALSVFKDQISILPRASIVIFIGIEAAEDMEALIKNEQHLLL